MESNKPVVKPESCNPLFLADVAIYFWVSNSTGNRIYAKCNFEAKNEIEAEKEIQKILSKIKEVL